MKDSRQRILDKLAKTRSVDNIKLSAIDNIAKRLDFLEECKRACEYFAYTEIPDLQYHIQEQLDTWASYFDNEFAGSVATLLGDQIKQVEDELNPLLENLDYLGLDYSEVDVNGLSLNELISELNKSKEIYEDFKAVYINAVKQFDFIDDMSNSFS